VSSLRAALPPGVVARQAEPLSRHTPLRTGGPCAWFLVVHRVDALGGTLDLLKERGISWNILGAGTRKVFRDGEAGGAMIRLGTELQRLETDGPAWTVGAGVPCAALAWAAAEAGRTGLQALARIPGTLGAALANDEGDWRAHFAEVAEFRRGQVSWREQEKSLNSKLILGARLDLPHEDRDRVVAATADVLRGATALPTWYERPKRGTAEAELRRVQMAGVRLRGVCIPEAAPEMIVNVGKGPASDLKLLHSSALKRVKQLRGVELSSAVTWTGRS